MKNIITNFIFFTLFFPLNVIFGGDDKKRDNLRMQKSEIRKHFLDKNQSSNPPRKMTLLNAKKAQLYLRLLQPVVQAELMLPRAQPGLQDETEKIQTQDDRKDDSAPLAPCHYPRAN